MIKKISFNPAGENAYLLYVALFKFILLIFFAGNYGLFRDEFYYIECSKHLDWGYVDQPPLSLFILAVSRTLFGESLLAIRIFAYAASCITVFVTGLIARGLGGGKYAQVLAAVCAVFSPVILGGGSIFSMNAFDVLFAAIMFYLLVQLIKSDNPKLWIWFGVICGIGLQNKLSFLFLGSGLAVALVLTKQRKYFLRKELYIGAAIAILIFLPHLIWQYKNGFPTLEFMRNASERKNVRMGFFDFFLASMMELNPVFIILLIAAFYFLFFNKEGKRFAILAWMYIVIFIVFVLNSGKPYYMGVLFPMMIAAGTVGAETIIENYLKNWVRYVFAVLLLPAFFLVAPFAIPILSVETYLKFSDTTGIRPSSGERHDASLLPQYFADRFGWKEMVEKVAVVFNRLTDEEKKHIVIFAQNYGEAGALNYYAEQFGLPDKIYSPHNSYWFWGPPKDWDGSISIVIGSNKEDNSEFFEEVELSASHSNKYGMPYENVDIFICRKVKKPISEIWEQIKFFI